MNSKCLGIAVVALLLVTGNTSFAAAATKKPDPVDEMAAVLEPARTVVYKTVNGRELHLHIFEPPGFKSTDKRPAFLAIHGGGWTGGEPRRFYPFAAHFANLGMVGISLEYRLINAKAGTTPFECVKDGRSAVRYLRAHAKELGIDPDKIVTSGGSAGGHVATAGIFDKIDEAGEDSSISPLANAMVLYFPVIDTSTEGYGNAKCGDRWKEISPAHQVRKGLPSTIVFHGTGDTTTPFKGAKTFHEEMLKAGNSCELVVNDGGKHGYLMFDRALYDEAMKKSEEFLTKLGYLKKP